MKTKFVTIPTSYVAFLDILGFRDLVDNNDHMKLTKIFEHVNDKILGTLVDNYNLSKEGIMGPQGEQFGIDSLFISDSIILWTKNNFQRSFIKLLLLTSDIISLSLIGGFPIRGAISIGPISLYKKSNNITLFGKGLTNSYQLEQIQNWAGCIIDDNAIKEFDKTNHEFITNGGDIDSIILTEQLIETIELIAKYKVPLKTGAKSDYFVINWPKNKFCNDAKIEVIIQSFGDYSKRTDDWKTEYIIKNTIDYFNSKNGI